MINPIMYYPKKSTQKKCAVGSPNKTATALTQVKNKPVNRYTLPAVAEWLAP